MRVIVVRKMVVYIIYTDYTRVGLHGYIIRIIVKKLSV